MKPIGFSYYTFTGIYIYCVLTSDSHKFSKHGCGVCFRLQEEKNKSYVFVAVSVMHTNALACKINVS